MMFLQWRYLGQSRQIHQGQGQDMGRVDTQVDGQGRNSCGGIKGEIRVSGHTRVLLQSRLYPGRPIPMRILTSILSGLCIGVAHNLVADLVEVCVLDARLMEELAPLLGFFLVVLAVLVICGMNQGTKKKVAMGLERQTKRRRPQG